MGMRIYEAGHQAVAVEINQVGLRPLEGHDTVLAAGGHDLAIPDRKGLDAVVVNDISRADIGFEGDHNEVTIVTATGDEHIERASKAEVARAICDAVVALRAKVASS